MIFNINKLITVCLVSVVATLLINSGCGKSEGFANSGTENTYHFVYIGSLGSSTINSYYLNDSGNLIIAANTIATGGGTSNISDFDYSKNTKFLYGANRASNNVSWYEIQQMNATNEGSIAFTNVEAAGAGASSVAIHPSGDFMYVTNSNKTPPDNISFFYIDDQTGALNSADRTYTARTGASEMVFTPSGNHLFVVNRTTNDFTSFSVSSTGILNTLTLSNATGTSPEDITISPDGTRLYVLCNGNNRVYQYSVSAAGVVAALSTPFVATGNSPKKIVITPNGKYIFVTNNTDNTIGVYAIDSSTGLLTAVSGSPFAGPSGAGVYAMDVTTDSKFLIVSGDTDARAYVFSIDDASGSLTQVGSGVDLGGSNPRAVKVVPLTAIE